MVLVGRRQTAGQELSQRSHKEKGFIKYSHAVKQHSQLVGAMKDWVAVSHNKAKPQKLKVCLHISRVTTVDSKYISV